jgi:hypothetical protein
MQKIIIINLFLLSILILEGCSKTNTPLTPVLTTTIISNITALSATSGGDITSDAGSPVTARGICWSTSPKPTIALSTKTVDGTGIGNFKSNLNLLNENTTYYVRAYATNIKGTGYGNEISFKTTKLDLNLGLVAYFPFTGNANDSSGNGNNGVINGAPKLVVDRFGKLNNAYSFSQKADYIKATGFNLINGNQSRTYSFWARIPSSTEGGICLSYGPELSQPNSNCNVGNHIDLNQSTGADFGFLGLGLNVNCYQIRNPISLNDGKWHHILLSYEGKNGFSGLQFFVDGVLLTSNSSFQGTVNLFNTQSLGYGLTIGRRIDADSYNTSLVHFKGDLDDIRIYNRALSTTEITYLASH